MRSCSVCGKKTLGSRCPEHTFKKSYGRPHRRAAAAVMAAARVCAICGEPPRPGDPLVRDHKRERAAGGKHLPENYQASHQSCNSERGQRFGQTLISDTMHDQGPDAGSSPGVTQGQGSVATVGGGLVGGLPLQSEAA